MGLYKKMHAVMLDSEGIEKNMTVGSKENSYKAISEAAVLNEIKPLLKKHGLVIFPVGVTITEDFKEFQGKYGMTQRYLSTLHCKYKIVDVETGEFEILESVGYGADSQDKGSGKAMTYAYKALIQKTFCLFSGEDTDNEHSDDITSENTSVEPQNVTGERKIPPLMEDSKTPDKPSDGQLGRLYAIAKSKGSDKKAVDERIATHFKCKAAEMSMVQYKKAVSSYEAMPNV